MDKEKKWNICRLDQVARLVSGRTPDRENQEYYASSGTPWVKIENLGKGSVREAAEYLSEEGRKKVNLVPRGSVLISTVGTVGKVGIAGCELATNQQIVSLIFQEEQVWPLYGYYCLRYFAPDIRRLADKTTMAIISRKTLGQYRIPVPEDLEEQKRIADELGRYEDFVREKERMREEFIRYEARLFQRMFGKEIRLHERLPLKEFLREPVMYGVPKALDPDNSLPGPSMKEYEASYLGKGEMTGNRPDGGEAQRAEEDPEAIGKYRVEDGDILIRSGQILLADSPEKTLYFDRNETCVRTRFGQLLPEVLAPYLRQPQIQTLLYTEKKPGDSRKRPIRTGEMEKLSIPYFSLEKQKEFAVFHKKILEILRRTDEMTACGKQLFNRMARILLTEKRCQGTAREEWYGQEAGPEIPGEPGTDQNVDGQMHPEKWQLGPSAAEQLQQRKLQPRRPTADQIQPGHSAAEQPQPEQSAKEQLQAEKPQPGHFVTEKLHPGQPTADQIPSDKLRRSSRENRREEGRDRRQEEVAHLVLAVLCGWCPQDGAMEEYCQSRQKILGKLQPYFYPVALALVWEDKQKEYLLERDFLAYQARELSRDWTEPLPLLISLLKERRYGKLRDAHLVFRGEQGLVTEAVWDGGAVKHAARQAAALLAGYSGMEDCCFLLQEETEQDG